MHRYFLTRPWRPGIYANFDAKAPWPVQNIARRGDLAVVCAEIAQKFLRKRAEMTFRNCLEPGKRIHVFLVLDS